MVQTYTISEIEHISKNISSTYDSSILEFFKSIKRKNKFIDYKPIRINVHEKVKSIKEKINSNLNKLSEKNFTSISPELLEIVKNSSENMNILIQSIISEFNNNNIMIKLLKFISTEVDITSILKNIINQYFQNNIILRHELDLSNTEDYEHLCNCNKEKENLKNMFIFINKLEDNNLIENNTEFISLLVDNIDKQYDKLYNEIFIQCLLSLLNTSVTAEMKDKLQVISTNKEDFNSRTRFAIIDFLEQASN